MPTSVEVRKLTDEESWHLSTEFAFMLGNLIPLMNKEVEVEKLKRFLQHFRDVRTGLPYVDPKIYESCASTAEVLDALVKQQWFHSTQLNLLKTIVGKYGCVESQSLLQEYELKLPKSAPLKKRSRNEHTDVETVSSYGSKKLKVDINGDADTYSLNDVEVVQEALEKTSRVSRDVIVLEKLDPGSVILTFIVPACTVGSFTDLEKSEKHLSDLAAVGILSIKIDHVTINVKAHLVPKETLSPKRHPTKLKPSTLQPTPGSEGTDSRGVMDPTVSQHGLLHVHLAGCRIVSFPDFIHKAQ